MPDYFKPGSFSLFVSSTCSCDETKSASTRNVPVSADNTTKMDYVPAFTETYLIKNMKRLQLDGGERDKLQITKLHFEN